MKSTAQRAALCHCAGTAVVTGTERLPLGNQTDRWGLNGIGSNLTVCLPLV